MNTLIIEERNRVAYFTINRPEKRNALHPDLIAALGKAFMEAGENERVKVIVLKANGKVFCAGADLDHLLGSQERSAEENYEDAARLKNLLSLVYSLPKLLIAQVEGYALAGGCGLVSVCDLVFSTPEARYGYPEVKIGFLPALVAPFLKERVNASRAAELLVSGDLITAEKALEYGLVNFIADGGEIADQVTAYAERICRENSAVAMAAIKKLVKGSQPDSFEEQLKKAMLANASARETADFKKGVESFVNKRKISW